MARINIEDTWLLDPRRKILIRQFQSEFMADGCAYALWRMAQEFAKAENVKKHGGLIPHSFFEHFEGREQVIAASLVELRESGVYVRGAADFCDFLKNRRDAGSKGGKAKRSKAKQSKANSSKRNQTEASSSSSSSSSDSVSDSNSETPSAADGGSGGRALQLAPTPESPPMPTRAEAKPLAQQLIARYCELWKARYRTESSPPIGGKAAGVAVRLIQDHGYQKAVYLLEAFLSMPETYYVHRRHDLALLPGDVVKVNHFAETRRVVSQSELRQLDDRVQTENLLAEIRENGI